jgi:hypothetical protein
MRPFGPRRPDVENQRQGVSVLRHHVATDPGNAPGPRSTATVPGVGRRSRTRARDEAVAAPLPRAAKPRRQRSQRPTTTRTRKVLSIQLGLIVALCVLVLVGIVALGSSLGPFIVIAYATIGGGLVLHWSRTQLANETLNDEDRVLQMVGFGLLGMAVTFSLLSALLVNLV